MRVAVVGSGISGLAAAHKLRAHAHVTLFEAGSYFGGHTRTVDVTLPTAQGEQRWGVDTGFLVFNDRTYPRLIALFDELGVPSTASEMSFSVRVDAQRLEWAGTDLAALFAQPSNAFRPAYWRMLADIVRWRREHQPGGQNAGSVFVNPDNGARSAGEIIDRLGLRGLRIGGAAVSDKHANFIQADAGASSADVVRVMLEVHRRVLEAEGLSLRSEVRLVGFAPGLPFAASKDASSASGTARLDAYLAVASGHD